MSKASKDRDYRAALRGYLYAPTSDTAAIYLATCTMADIAAELGMAELAAYWREASVGWKAKLELELNARKT